MLNVHDHYQNMKHAISADKSTPDRALSLVKEDFFDNIKNIVLEHQDWHKERKVSLARCRPSYPCVMCRCLNLQFCREATLLWSEDLQGITFLVGPCLLLGL